MSVMEKYEYFIKFGDYGNCNKRPKFTQEEKEYLKACKILHADPSSEFQYHSPDIVRISFITLQNLTEILAECPSIIELDAHYNESPSVNDFLNFIKDNEEFTAFGHLCNYLRGYAGLSITGIKYLDQDKPLTEEQIKKFKNFAGKADELWVSKDKTYARAWWD